MPNLAIRRSNQPENKMQNATNIENALPQSKARTTLDAVRERVGFVPNLFAMLAEQPGVVEAFVALDTALTNTSLSPIERQVVQLTTSVENRGHYCVAGHSIFGRSIGMPEQAIEAIRSGAKVDDERLSALHTYVVQLVRARGHVRPKDVEALTRAGFAREQILEIVMGVTLKTFSNYADSAMRLTLDKQFEPAAWSGTDEDHQ